MVVGENGILNRATDAKNKTDEASQQEKSDFEKMADLIDETVSGTKIVEQVKDENPGKLEVDGGEKVINSIEDLVFFAYDVKNGNTYEGQTVKLGLSLDFNSSKSYVNAYRTDYGKYGYNGELKELLTNGDGFIPIGETIYSDAFDTTKFFNGIFEGNYNKILNLKINKKLDCESEKVSIGFFSNNYGTIKNLEIEKILINTEIKSSNFCSVGGLTGSNFGTIQNCYASGEISGVYFSNINYGGINGGNGGNILNCCNSANINLICNSLIEEEGSIRIRRSFWFK